MGLLDHEINGTIRISFGRNTTSNEAESAASELMKAVSHLRNLKEENDESKQAFFDTSHVMQDSSMKMDLLLRKYQAQMECG